MTPNAAWSFSTPTLVHDVKSFRPDNQLPALGQIPERHKGRNPGLPRRCRSLSCQSHPPTRRAVGGRRAVQEHDWAAVHLVENLTLRDHLTDSGQGRLRFPEPGLSRCRCPRTRAWRTPGSGTRCPRISPWSSMSDRRCPRRPRGTARPENGLAGTSTATAAITMTRPTTMKARARRRGGASKTVELSSL